MAKGTTTVKLSEPLNAYEQLQLARFKWLIPPRLYTLYRPSADDHVLFCNSKECLSRANETLFHSLSKLLGSISSPWLSYGSYKGWCTLGFKMLTRPFHFNIISSHCVLGKCHISVLTFVIEFIKISDFLSIFIPWSVILLDDKGKFSLCSLVIEIC